MNWKVVQGAVRHLIGELALSHFFFSYIKLARLELCTRRVKTFLLLKPSCLQQGRVILVDIIRALQYLALFPAW